MKKNLSKLMWFFREHRVIMTVVVLISILQNVFTIASPIVLGRAVDDIAGGAITRPVLSNYILILAVCAVLLYVTGYLWSYFIFRNSRIIEYRLLNILMDKILYMPRTFFEKFLAGDLMTRANTSLESIREFVSFGFMAFFDSLLYLPTVILIMGFYISWKLTFFACIPLVVVALMTNKSGKYIYKFYNKQQEALSKLSDNVLENVAGIRLVRAYNLEEKVYREFEDITNSVYTRSLNTEKVQNMFWPIANTFLSFSYAISLILGATMISAGEISLGEMITFNIFLGYITWPMYAIGEFVNVSQRASSATNKFYEVLEMKNDLLEDGVTLHPLAAFGDIEFKDYHFQYPLSAERNLTNINLAIPKGHTLGIAGKTGSGKSTLIKQLLMQYPFGSGEIQINGENIKSIEKSSLMDFISYVSQDNILFSNSIRENVLFGLHDQESVASDAPESASEHTPAKPSNHTPADASFHAPAGTGKNRISKTKIDDAVMHSIRLADLERDVNGFTLGLDTQVGERGIAISGGQKQRVAIARALIKNADLLILDDSLSAVDARTEAKILENIKQNREGKTNIIISHRLSAISHADEIIVLDNGRIVERGTHEELMSKDSWYKKQYDIQKLEEEKNDGE